MTARRAAREKGMNSMRMPNYVALGVLAVVASLMAACASEVSPSDVKQAISAEAAPAANPCNEILDADSIAATPERPAMQAACSLNSAMATGGEGPDPGFVVWCDNGMCCIAGDNAGTICCCDDTPSCYCG